MAKRLDLDTVIALHLMAGIMGMTNLGMPIPDRKAVLWHRKELLRWLGNAQDKRALMKTRKSGQITVQLAQSYIESDAMERMFVREGDGWERDLRKMPLDDVKRIWPEYWALVQPEDETSKS